MKWPFVRRSKFDQAVGWYAAELHAKVDAEALFSLNQQEYVGHICDLAAENSRLKEELVDQNCSPLRDERISLRRRLDTEFENVKARDYRIKELNDAAVRLVSYQFENNELRVKDLVGVRAGDYSDLVKAACPPPVREEVEDED